MRRCEKCGGQGPCLWAERGPDCQRYLCRRCHPNPEDGFFTRTVDAVRARVRPAEVGDPPATRAVRVLCEKVTPSEIEWREEDSALVVRWSCGCLENAGPIGDWSLIPAVVKTLARGHERCAEVSK